MEQLRAYKPWAEALTSTVKRDDGSVFVELQPGNGTRYPIIVSAAQVPGFSGIQVTLLWHFKGWRSYCFLSKPTIDYLAEKWNFDKSNYGDLDAVLNYWNDLAALVK